MNELNNKFTELSGDRLTILSLCWFGLLTKETTEVLQVLASGADFPQAGSKLFERGMTTSRNHGMRVISEIKKRFFVVKNDLPGMADLISIANSNAKPVVMAQVFFVYLYFSDEFVAHITDKLGDVFNAHSSPSIVTRKDIKMLLTTYLEAKEIYANEKVIRNWLGRYLSIMRETNLLVRKKQHDYVLNFMGIEAETWLFFTLHAHFSDIKLTDARFLKAFQITPERLPKAIERFDSVKSAIYKMASVENGKQEVIVSTPYRKLDEWIADVQ